jgi:hypothetical protein
VNWQQFADNWSDMKSEVHTRWPKLSPEDISLIGGRRKNLIRTLSECYSIPKIKAEAEAEGFIQALQLEPGSKKTAAHSTARS